MSESKIPLREEFSVDFERPPRRWKLRVVTTTVVLFAVLAAGWVAGLNSRESLSFAQTSTWLQQAASAMLLTLEERRKLGIASAENLPNTSPREAISPRDVSEKAPAAEVLEHADGLSIRLDQVRASSEAAIKVLDSGIERLNGSVERGQRELLTKLDQLQERLDRIERHSAADSITKQAQPVEQSNATPPTTQVVVANQPSAAAMEAKKPPKATPTETKKIENWVVREVVNGTAILEGPRGVIGVSTGNVVPGVGRVESISRRGRQWIVATSKGVITAR